MELEIEEFRRRLAQEQAQGTDPAAYIYHEIRLTEHVKIGLIEEMNIANQQFVVEASQKIDAYLYKLQELEKQLRLPNVSLDQKTAINDAAIRTQIGAAIQKLEGQNPEHTDLTNGS